MQLIAGKSRLNGLVKIPASKSHTIRAVTVASLAKGKSCIRNPLVSGDTLSAVACYRALGAQIDTFDKDCWKVAGTAGLVETPKQAIDVGNSGTTLRLAMGSASLATQGHSITFTGDQQTRTRQIGPLMRSLADLGAKCLCLNENERAPVTVTGRLKGGKTSIEAFSSQYLSSLLLCTPLADNDTIIDATVLNEPGYVKITVDWLKKQKIDFIKRGLRHFKIKGCQSYRPFDEEIIADFSSATFFLCAAALIGDEVTLQGLDFADSQPDKAVADYLMAMGADVTIGKKSVTVRAKNLKGIEIDMNNTPDALPAMAVVAAFAEGTTRLVNVPQARAKETDRIKCMAEELYKLGVSVDELPDGLIIRQSNPRCARVSGRGDHRIVMAMSLAGMAIEGQTCIDTAEAMNVTFPQYLDLMKSIGGNLELR